MTYSAITNAQVAAGAPVTTALMTALRDNTDAILNGITTGGFYAAGDWHLIDIMEPGSNVNAIVSSIDPSQWAAVRIFGIANKAASTGEDFQVEIRQTSGTWRRIGFFSTGTNRGIIFDLTIFNTDDNDAADVIISLGGYTDQTSVWTWASTGVAYNANPGNWVAGGLGGYGETWNEVRVSMTGGQSMVGGGTSTSRYYVWGVARAQSDVTS